MKKYDFVVAGGGLSGVAAAVAASREGLSVLIVEESGSFGGAMTTMLVFPFMKHWHDLENGERILYSRGLFEEMKRRERLLSETNDKSTLRDRIFSPEYFKMALDEMIGESSVDVLFHSSVVGVKVNCDRRSSVEIQTENGKLEIEADFFVDATGDGDMIALSGCEFQLGREKDCRCQPMTICYRCSNVDVEQFYKEDTEFLDALYKEHQAKGLLKNPRENLLFMHGIDKDVLHFNTTRVLNLDPTDPFELSKAEIEGRKQVLEMHRFLKENSPAYRNAKIISIATHIGIRESRKLKGLHVLTADEIKNCTKFEDSVACGNYDIDIHSPDGTGTYIHSFNDGEYYTVPYRSLVPKEYKNMLVVGRCLSAEHEAHSAVRIMPICACMGEAAGVAIGVAFNTGKTTHDVDIKKVQDKLRSYGAVID